MSSSSDNTLSEDLFKEAGALGVYSYYYNNNINNSNLQSVSNPQQPLHKYTYRSPIRTTTNHSYRTSYPTSPTRSSQSSSTSTARTSPIKRTSQIMSNPNNQPLSKRSSSNALFDHLQHHATNPDIPSRLSTPLSLDPNNSSNNNSAPLSSGIRTVNPTPIPHNLTNSNLKLFDQPPPRLTFMSPNPLTEDEMTLPTRELIHDALNNRKLPIKQPTTLDLCIKLMSMLTGKDKIGKCIQYGLRILIAYSGQIRKSSFLSSYNLTDINFKSSNQDILFQLIKRPELLLILILGQFEAKFVGITKHLSIYRQMLRAGTVPFKFIKLMERINVSLSLILNDNSMKNSTKLQKLKDDWCNIKSLSQVTAMYYSFFDESLLAFKLGLFPESWTRFKAIASKHEPIAWYMNILIGLRNQFEMLSELNNKENSIKINWQVKQRAKKLIAGIKSNNSPISLAADNSTSSSISSTAVVYSTELKKIQYDKRMVKLEILKLLCDLGYDSVVVFNLTKNINPASHLMFGFGAAFVSTAKIWITERDKMIKDMNED